MNKTDFQNAALAQNTPFLILDYRFFPLLGRFPKEEKLPYVENVISKFDTIADFEELGMLQPNADDSIFEMLSDNEDFPVRDGDYICRYVLNIKEWSIYNVFITAYLKYMTESWKIT